MAEEEKKVITREKHPGCVAEGHKLAALMKKRKEEILRNKEQSTVQSTVVYRTAYRTAYSTAFSTVKWSLYLWRWYLQSLPLVFVYSLSKQEGRTSHL